MVQVSLYSRSNSIEHYDGADPQNARNWVGVTLPTITKSGDVREATFGGVKFLLYGIPSARFLEFGDVSE